MLPLLVASPAQAGLGDLLGELLDPVEDVPIVGEVVPVVEEIVEPVIQAVDPVVQVVDPVIEIIEPLVEPVVEDVITPVVEIVTPTVEDVVEPTVEDVAAPAVEMVTPTVEDVVEPTVEDVITPAVERLTPPVEDVVEPVVDEVVPVKPEETELPANHLPTDLAEIGLPSSNTASMSDDVQPRPVEVLAGTSGTDVSASTPDQRTDAKRFSAAAAVQATLLTSIPTWSETATPLSTDVRWLAGLTGWLRAGAEAILDLLSLPIRLLDILIRALATAGSGLVAPASMLLAFVGYAISDRRRPRGVTIS